jgi:hypothetical protein
MFFVNVARVEVFANNAANVRVPGDHLLAQLVFGKLDDARTFADLVRSTSMRRHRFSRKNRVALVAPFDHRGQVATGWKLLLVCVVSTLSVGCPSTIQYQSDDRLVETMGVSQAQQRLTEVLLRAVNPKIDRVEVTDEFVRYHLTGTTYEIRLFFTDVHRVEVYSNAVVLVRGQNNDMLIRPLLANTQDAQTFTDLLLSFRAHNARRAS